MTLQDDIEKALFGDMPIHGVNQSARADVIATEIEREYYLVKLADLPELSGDIKASLDNAPDTAADHLADVRWYLAQALYLEARESEEAVLARRRDELTQECAPDVPDVFGYDSAHEWLKAAVDRVIAAEDEVARLKAKP